MPCANLLRRTGGSPESRIAELSFVPDLLAVEEVIPDADVVADLVK